MHAKVFSIQIFPIFASNSAEGLHLSAFHFIIVVTVVVPHVCCRYCGCPACVCVPGDSFFAVTCI